MQLAHRRTTGATRRGLVAVATLLLAAAPAGAAEERFEGIVTDAAGHPLADVAVVLYPSRGGATLRSTTSESGAFAFEVGSGGYTAVFFAEGYGEQVQPIRLGEGEQKRLEVTLELARSTSVTVEAPVDARYGERVGDAREFSGRDFDALRLPSDRFQEALPLLPGVVRDPRGRLSFNGTRPSQSLLLVNGSNATDPLTGEFAVELPLKAVETVEVHTLPYSAEFGRVTGAVAEVTTRPGDDHWDVDFGGLLPSLRFRNGTIMGINSAVPHVQVSGPLRKGRSWIAQGVTYRFVRSRARNLDEPVDEELLESFDSFTQLTTRLGERHTLTGTVSFFPVEVDNLGIDPLHPEAATPDFGSEGWNVALAHRFTADPDTLLETTVALKSFDVLVEQKGSGPARLGVDGLRENYFNAIDRDSSSLEVRTGLTRVLRESWGTHLLGGGIGVSWRRFHGTDRGSDITVVGAAGEPLRTIAFVGAGELESSDVAGALWVKDEWRPSPRLGLQLGLRYDLDRISEEHNLSPRAAFSWSVDGDGSTILKGGWGLFYDRIPLHADAFESFQRRVETRVDGAERERLEFRNLRDGRLRMPRSSMWNLELNQDLAGVLLRVNYRERRGNREAIVNRLEDAPGGPALQLSSTGTSTTRELDVTLRKGFAEGQELLFSWSKIRSSADLNDFDGLYGNLRDPIVLESERSLQPHDVPSRVLLWGRVELPWKLELAPAVEWRRGFPYTVFEEDYTPASTRNRGGRFPSFFSLDLRLTREVALFGHRTRLGVQAFNLTDHFNPRDVYANRASDRFGEFVNSVRISVGLRVQVLF